MQQYSEELKDGELLNEGLYPAYITGLFDRGLVESKFYLTKDGQPQKSHKITLVITIDTKQIDGKHNISFFKTMTLSNLPNSTMYKFVTNANLSYTNLSDLLTKKLQVMLTYVDMEDGASYMHIEDTFPSADFTDFYYINDCIPNWLKEQKSNGILIINNKEKEIEQNNTLN